MRSETPSMGGAGDVDARGTAARVRDGSLPLLLLCALVALGGDAARRWHAGVAPADCPRPALDGVVLRCDGQGRSPGARLLLTGRPPSLNELRRIDLENLPGIGPSIAARILEARSRHGGFHTWSEVDAIAGVGPKTLLRLQESVGLAGVEELTLPKTIASARLTDGH